MKVIEETRWEGGKTVGVKRARRKMKRGMDGNEECVKINKLGKTKEHTRWKRGEFVVVENQKTK